MPEQIRHDHGLNDENEHKNCAGLTTKQIIENLFRLLHFEIITPRQDFITHKICWQVV